MADKKEKEAKIILEREYIVPLRKGFKKVAYYKRARRAVKELVKFIAKHMKVEDRDERKVKIDKYVNQELWFRGIRNPLAKIKVKAIKFDSGIVKVELVDIPEKVKWQIEKEKKLKEHTEKKKAEKKVEEPVEPKKEDGVSEEKKMDEDKKATVEAGLQQANNEAKEMKHETKMKHEPKHKMRMALQK
jgi:large subunit ribosomal protein L31e